MLGDFPSLNEPMRNWHTRCTKNVSDVGESHKNGTRISGENGPQLAHLRLISSKCTKILELGLLLLLLLREKKGHFSLKPAIFRGA